MVFRDIRTRQAISCGEPGDREEWLAERDQPVLGPEAGADLSQVHGGVDQGLWPSYAPLGYLNIKRPDGKNTIEPDPSTSGLVVKLFEEYATGKYSLTEITRMAKATGLRYQKSGGVLPKSAVHKLLKNKLYSGDFDWAGKEYRGSHTPLISRELWECVQDTLEGRNSNKPHQMKHHFAFSGLLTCGHC